jgi:Xaa-Pro aminopeptidase
MRRFTRWLVVIAPLLILLSAVQSLALEREPSADYHARRIALGTALKGGVAIRQDEDFYYLTGWNEPGAALVVIGASEPAAPGTAPVAGVTAETHGYREILFLPTRNKRIELYTGVKLDAASPEAVTKTGVAEVKDLAELPVILNALVAGNRRELQKMWVQQDMPQGKNAVAFTAASLGVAADSAPTPSDVRSLTTPLRAVKQPGEVALIRKATNASMMAQRAAIQAIKPELNEDAIAGILIGTLLTQGCERFSYPPIVGSGVNSTVLHYSDDNQVMHAGDLVVMDAAGEYSMYASDITRTMPVSGHFTARQK